MPPLQFDLHKLGWKAFEDLVTSILRDTMGPTFQVFADGVDGGRDGAFVGTWKPSKDDAPLSGKFAVQCKHTGKAGKKLPDSVVSEELPKVTLLASQGLADIYLFFTNYSLTAGAAKKAEEKFEQAGAKRAIVFGAEWINHSIVSNPSLRRLVPRLYGLGDLTQVVTHQAYRQAKEVLDSISPDLACFVTTDAYRKCAHALKEHGFVILIGEPASGKTMIANLMALSAADEWNLQTLILNTPEDFDRLWNPDDPGQFFWVDDAFGSNQYDHRRVQEWNQRIPKLKVAINKGARAVFTSRNYIFRTAQQQLNTQKFELFNDSRVTIEVEKLSESERAMMLYNHLKLGKQPKEFLSDVKEHLEVAAATPKFLPEIARRFASPKFTSNVPRTEAGVRNFFVNPVAVMEDIIKGLAFAEKAAIALIFSNGGSLPIPLPEDVATNRTIASMQSNVGDVKAALISLDDALLRKNGIEDGQYWQFRHPTIHDAFASIIGNNPELIDIYISGATKERLVGEVSCGDMGIEGVKVIIPPSGFERVLKIIAPGGHEKDLVEPVTTFLARKCSLTFLRLYFNSSEVISLLPGLMRSPNSYDAALTLIKRLKQDNLLPDDIREEAVKRIRSLAEGEFWDGFIDGDLIGNLVTAEENEKFIFEQKDVVYSNKDEIISEIESSWSVDDDVDDAYYYIKKLINRFLEENESNFGDDSYDASETEAAQKFIDAIDANISSMKTRQSDSKEYDELETEETSEVAIISSRSIFDDIDD